MMIGSVGAVYDVYDRTRPIRAICALIEHSCPRQLKIALFGQVKPFVLNKPRL